MEKHNTVHAIFTSGEKVAEIKDDVWQYDFGQILQIEGLPLPPVVEVHYANKGKDIALPQTGVTEGGITSAPIPNEILEEKGAFTAYIFVTDGESGETCYTINGYVNKRPPVEGFNTPEDQEILHAAVGAVNAAAERAESAETKATEAANQTAEDAQKTGADRAEVERLVESVSGIGEQVTKVENLTKQAQTSATNAALSEQAAKTAETNAQTAQAGAEAAEGNAELAERNVKASEQAVEKAKQLVTQMGQEVLDNKNHVDQTVQEFDQTAQQAVANVNNAGQTQTERVQSAGNTAVESVESAQRTATEAVETAKTEAIKTIQEEGVAQIGTVAAEGEKQVQAVQDAAAEIVADRQQIQKNAVDIESLGNNKADAIVSTASGEQITLTDSDNELFKGLHVYGKSTQQTTAGVNLLDPNKYVAEVFGIKSVVENNGSISIKGITTKTGNFRLASPLNIDITTEMFLGMEVESNVPFNINHYNNDYTINAGFLVTQNGNYNYKYESLPTIDNGIFISLKELYLNSQIDINIKMYIGKLQEYEPYTGGKPSPSIEYPQEIMSAGDKGNVNIQVKGNVEPVQNLLLPTPNGLLGIPVSTGGNYTDANGQQWICNEIDFGRGKYVQRVEKVNFDGSADELWTVGDSSTGNRYASIPLKNRAESRYDNKITCNIALPKLWNAENFCFINEYKYFSYYDSSAPTSIFENVDNFKQWLIENPIEILYKLETPIERDLTPEEITAYKALHTNYPVTTILNDAGAGMVVEYVADTKHYIDKKFEELNAKVVNTQIALL